MDYTLVGRCQGHDRIPECTFGQDGFRDLSIYTDGFSSAETCSAYHIAKAVISKIGEMSEIERHMTHLFNAILLATGKSDNNLKCQYPIVLHRLFGSDEIAVVKNGKLAKVRIPRDFSMEKVVKHFSALAAWPELLSPLLKSYLDLLLSDDGYVMQLALLESFTREFPLVTLTTKELLKKIQWLIDNEFVILK